MSVSLLRVQCKAGIAKGPQLGPETWLVQSRTVLVGQWVVVVYDLVLSRSDQEMEKEMR